MIDFSFLSPVQDRLVDQIELLHGQAIGKKIVIHTSKGTPDFERCEDCNYRGFGV